MQTWVSSVGQRALGAPAGFRQRWRFWRASLTAALRAPRKETRHEIWRAGVRQLPLISFVGLALGLLVVGQAVALLQQVNAKGFIGTLMVTVVLRELGPLLTAFLVAARSGSAMVVELGVRESETHRMRELVGPRVRALGVTVFCLTMYLIAVALTSGYLVAFVQKAPLRFGAYCTQLADAMHWMDFVLIGMKSALFGVAIGVVTCYHGWVRTMQAEDLPGVATRAVVESLAMCVLLDAVFLAGYFAR